jgi:hypothetical protein
MRNQFTLERHALERHQIYLREVARDRLVHQSDSPVAPTTHMTIGAPLMALTVLTVLFASSAWSFVTHISSAAIVA